MSIAARLDLALRAAGIPIIGVSIGDEADRATWRIQFELRATAQQRTDGAALVATFDPNAAALLTSEREQRIAAESRRHDVLATCALVVRSRNVIAWNALTVDQKILAILTESDAWAAARDFVERTM